jgi:hypothetical protein
MIQMKDIHLNVITVTVHLSTVNMILGTVEQAHQLQSLIPILVFCGLSRLYCTSFFVLPLCIIFENSQFDLFIFKLV